MNAEPVWREARKVQPDSFDWHKGWLVAEFGGAPCPRSRGMKVLSFSVTSS